MDSFWAGVTSAGPVQAALEVVDAAALRRALEEAAGPYQHEDGRIRFEVTHRFVTAEGDDTGPGPNVGNPAALVATDWEIPPPVSRPLVGGATTLS